MAFAKSRLPALNGGFESTSSRVDPGIQNDYPGAVGSSNEEKPAVPRRRSVAAISSAFEQVIQQNSPQSSPQAEHKVTGVASLTNKFQQELLKNAAGANVAAKRPGRLPSIGADTKAQAGVATDELQKRWARLNVKDGDESNSQSDRNSAGKTSVEALDKLPTSAPAPQRPTEQPRSRRGSVETLPQLSNDVTGRATPPAPASRRGSTEVLPSMDSVRPAPPPRQASAIQTIHCPPRPAIPPRSSSPSSPAQPSQHSQSLPRGASPLTPSGNDEMMSGTSSPMTAAAKFAEMLERRAPKENETKREEKINQIIARMDQGSTGSLSGRSSALPELNASKESVSSRRGSGPLAQSAAVPPITTSQVSLAARSATSLAFDTEQPRASIDRLLGSTEKLAKSTSLEVIPTVSAVNSSDKLPVAMAPSQPECEPTQNQTVRSNSTPLQFQSSTTNVSTQPSAPGEAHVRKRSVKGSPLLMIKKSLRRQKSVAEDLKEVTPSADPGSELEARIMHYEQIKQGAMRMSSLHQNPKAKQLAKEQSDMAERQLSYLKAQLDKDHVSDASRTLHMAANRLELEVYADDGSMKGGKMQSELSVELRFRNNIYRLEYQPINAKSRTCSWDFPTLLTENNVKVKEVIEVYVHMRTCVKAEGRAKASSKQKPGKTEAAEAKVVGLGFVSMAQLPEAQEGQPLLTALFREGHMRFHWCDTSSPLLHGFKMRGLVKYNAPLAQTQGYMDVQIDDGRIRDWKLLYGVLKGDKILLWRDELDERKGREHAQEIHLGKITTQSIEPTRERERQITFRLEESPEMGYFICVHDAGEFNTWKAAIEKVLQCRP